VPRRGIAPRIAGIKPVDIGQQDQHVGAGHLRHPGGEAVVVAETDLGGGDRVVLVDHRHGAEAEQLGEGRAGVQMPPPLLGILQGQEDLRDGDVVAGQGLLIGMGEADLPGRGRRLLFLETQGAAAQPKMATADRDRAGRDDDHILVAGAAARDVIDQRVQPGAMDLAILIDEQGRADLDDEPSRRGQRRGGSRPAGNSLSALGDGEDRGEVGDSRALADAHLTPPHRFAAGPLPLPRKGGEGFSLGIGLGLHHASTSGISAEACRAVSIAPATAPSTWGGRRR